MKRTVKVLYHTPIERELLLARMSHLPELRLECCKLDELLQTCDQPTLVASCARDLPSSLRLKQLLPSASLLFFCPPALTSMVNLLQDERCNAVSLAAGFEQVKQAVLQLADHSLSCCVEHAVVLTRREQQVLALLVSGQEISSIAQSLGIKCSTVIAHKKHLFLKCNVHSTGQLIVWALLRQTEWAQKSGGSTTAEF